jgi:hypothetical protein
MMLLAAGTKKARRTIIAGFWSVATHGGVTQILRDLDSCQAHRVTWCDQTPCAAHQVGEIAARENRAV